MTTGAAIGTGTAVAPQYPYATDPDNRYPDDPSLYPAVGNPTPGTTFYPPRGGLYNIWMTQKPYVGQNAEIYVMLLDNYGEISGSPIQINLQNESVELETLTAGMVPNPDTKKTFLAKFKTGGLFVAFDRNNQPMAVDNSPGATPALPVNAKQWPHPTNPNENGTFDDQVKYYVDLYALVTDITAGTYAAGTPGTAPIPGTPLASGFTGSLLWVSSWGDINRYIRKITAPNFDKGFASADGDGAYYGSGYAWLLAPSGGVAQPKAFKEGSQYVYKVNVPSIMYQDIVLLDYYTEYQHNATQVSILPDAFAPYVYVEGSSLIRRASDGLDLPVEFVIPKFKITTALSFTLQSTGDPSTFAFSGDAYPDFSKFDLSRKVLADILILDADDNYDTGGSDNAAADPTDYRRFQYNEDQDGSYIWKDPSVQAHENLDYSDAYDYTIPDTGDQNTVYRPDIGGPESVTPGIGVISSNP